MFYYVRMKSNQSFRVVNGRGTYVHKQYVDVLVRNTADGQWLPFAVCWVDGRVFPIDEVVEEHLVGPSRRGKWTKKYDVRFGGYETTLHLEHYSDDEAFGQLAYTRWWVYAIDQVKRRERN